MSEKKKKEKITTPVFRGSYVNLVAARKFGKGDPRFSILAPFPENGSFVKKLRAAEKEVALEKWNKIPKKMKSALKSGDEREPDEETGKDQFEGMITINFAAAERPGCIYTDEDGDRVEIIDAQEKLYSGAYFRLTTRPYAWEHDEGGKGVSWSLDNVLWIKHGKAFSGKTSAEDDFANVVDEDEGDDDMLE